jgi:dienelactone hydrolase
MTTLPGWDLLPFSYQGETRDVLRRGAGPGIVVLHEIPGVTPKVAAYAERLVEAGFTVWMPVLFGEVGRSPTPGYLLGTIARTCVRREFTVLAANQSSPITDYLRALCRALGEATGGKVGAIGMCFTGGFALSLMVDPVVDAPVLSQPSLPFAVSRTNARALGLSSDELAAVKRRVADGVNVLGLRFTGDPACPRARFDRLREELGDGFEAIEIDSSPGNPWHLGGDAHSVLTEHLHDEPGHPTRQALERTIAFFRERLSPAPADR